MLPDHSRLRPFRGCAVASKGWLPRENPPQTFPRGIFLWKKPGKKSTSDDSLKVSPSQSALCPIFIGLIRLIRLIKSPCGKSFCGAGVSTVLRLVLPVLLFHRAAPPLRSPPRSGHQEYRQKKNSPFDELFFFCFSPLFFRGGHLPEVLPNAVQSGQGMFPRLSHLQKHPFVRL